LVEGEFLEGKYQGIWKYYDKNGKVIKKEKWDNGELIYRKGYK
jgi:antitoxin component YwqK of YwqJK toxin-antitoxin module